MKTVYNEWPETAIEDLFLMDMTEELYNLCHVNQWSTVRQVRISLEVEGLPHGKLNKYVLHELIRFVARYTTNDRALQMLYQKLMEEI